MKVISNQIESGLDRVKDFKQAFSIIEIKSLKIQVIVSKIIKSSFKDI